MAVLSHDEAEHLFGLKKTPLTDSIEWQPLEGGFLNLQFAVRCEDGTGLDVRGWYNPKTGKYGFALLHAGVYTIRRWDKKSGHRDPISHMTIRGPHKHYHHEDFGDSPASETQDVDSADVNRGLRDFLKECKVELGKTVIRPLLGSE